MFADGIEGEYCLLLSMNAFFRRQRKMGTNCHCCCISIINVSECSKQSHSSPQECGEICSDLQLHRRKCVRSSSTLTSFHCGGGFSEGTPGISTRSTPQPGKPPISREQNRIPWVVWSLWSPVSLGDTAIKKTSVTWGLFCELVEKTYLLWVKFKSSSGTLTGLGLGLSVRVRDFNWPCKILKAIVKQPVSEYWKIRLSGGGFRAEKGGREWPLPKTFPFISTDGDSFYTFCSSVQLVSSGIRVLRTQLSESFRTARSLQMSDGVTHQDGGGGWGCSSSSTNDASRPRPRAWSTPVHGRRSASSASWVWVLSKSAAPRCSSRGPTWWPSGWAEPWRESSSNTSCWTSVSPWWRSTCRLRYSCFPITPFF